MSDASQASVRLVNINSEDPELGEGERNTHML